MTPPVHVILITHTPERLRRTILGVAASSLVPDSVTLSCDSDDPAIRVAARDAATEAGVAVTLVTRAPAGAGRSSQARNNAVRALIAGDPDPGSVLVFFDGDCVPLHGTIARHAAALRPMGRADALIGWRYDLTPEQDAAFDLHALRRGAMPFEPTHEQAGSVRRRDARYRRQLVLRRLGLTKAHKPKLLSANFSCTLSTYRAVNGFDETFEGWGQEDDDFGKRLRVAGLRVGVGVRDVLVCHQHHVTRAPGDWSRSHNARLLRASRPARCERGLDNPVEQSGVTVELIEPASA